MRLAHGFPATASAWVSRVVAPNSHPCAGPAGASSGLFTPWRPRPLGSSPSLVHVMTSGIPARLRGTRPLATPRACCLSPSLPPEVPSLCRHYPASSVPTDLSATLPARPDPRGLSVGVCRATGRASRVATNPLFHTCHRQYPGGTGRCSRRSLPDRWQPSPFQRRVGFRSARFEACAAFTCVVACVVTEPPKAARCIGVLQTMLLPPPSAPTATGWSDSCRAGFAPAGEWCLLTAHVEIHAKDTARN